MYQFQINTYENIRKPSIKSTIVIEEWFKLIKSSNYSDDIIKARNGILDYNKTKLSLPCITYNFLFDGYKKDNNIVSSTGLLYIDIDNSEFNINLLDLSKIYSYYHSFGGKGYSIIVKVNNLTTTNFKDTYYDIASVLGITKYIDIQAVKASQFNVLSYDENIYINPSSIGFDSINTDNYSLNFAPPSIVIKEEKKKTYTIEGRANNINLRFDNLDEIDIPLNEDFITNWEGYEYIKCFIPMKKVSLNRNNFLLSYCTNLVCLNLHIDLEICLEVMRSVNKFGCEVPVDEKQLRRIVTSIFKYKEDGTLKPIYFWKLRKIIFNPNSKLSRSEKLEICRKELSKKLTEKSQIKIYKILEEWDFELYSKITQRNIYNNFPITKKTVEKYWTEFKSYIEILNKNYAEKTVYIIN